MAGVSVALAALVFSLSCLGSGTGATVGGPDGDTIFLSVNVSRVLKVVSERFLSVAIDASLLAEEKFMYLLSSQKLRTLAKALTPGFLRFGGTKQDFMVFSPHTRSNAALRPDDASLQSIVMHQSNLSAKGVCNALVLPNFLEERLKKEWAEQEVLLQKEEIQGHYSKVRFSEHAVDLLYSFANCSGFDLIFGLNALLRTKNNSWDSRNAETLLNYCESQNYSMSWELGNEPNSFEKKADVRVDGYQLGQDFLHLRNILKNSKLYHTTGLYGPDVSQPKNHRKDLLQGFLETAAKAIDACTWHHYYVNGREASMEDFLSPKVLDTLTTKITKVLQTVTLASPGKKVWLGETSSAYGGGATGLSDTFVAGFMWLDKLGLAAKLGIDVVVRQVLIGSGTYHMVDANLDPLPDYWLSILYKRLVGPEVLDADGLTNSGVPGRKLRVYLHCTNKKSPNVRKGAVTLFALNLSKKKMEIIMPSRLNRSSVEAFVLEAGKTTGSRPLTSRYFVLCALLLCFFFFFFFFF
uniref:Heparanase n=1 Tax=Scleropages formosus TaxID=113540 RepID=A0A8C9W062_SCLFO